MDMVYEAIKKIPGMTADEAHEVVSKLSKTDDVATKADLAELKAELLKQQVVVALLVIAAVGLMIKFL